MAACLTSYLAAICQSAKALDALLMREALHVCSVCPCPDTSNTAEVQQFPVAAGDCQHAHAPRLQWLGHRDFLQ